MLPLIRQLRLLRLVTVLNVLNRNAGLSLRGRVVVYTVGATALIVFPDAVWWSITTIITVGYGGRYPVSGTGRLVAVGLMVAGIALLGVVTATLASWLIRRVTEADENAQAVTREVKASRAELAAQRAVVSPAASEPLGTARGWRRRPRGSARAGAGRRTTRSPRR
ncbi:potassium channel family protein [Amycolatopsis coloradensis]|uniref:Potassium channel family protein n=1 Tax=Amycolatopsis coloradensis TaxID=76021 RepID=A0ACD5BAS5_9PSEU